MLTTSNKINYMISIDARLTPERALNILANNKCQYCDAVFSDKIACCCSYSTWTFPDDTTCHEAGHCSECHAIYLADYKQAENCLDIYKALYDERFAARGVVWDNEKNELMRCAKILAGIEIK